MYTVQGLFKQILVFENYLEQQFPEDPSGLYFDDNSFEHEEKNFEIPMDQTMYSALLQMGKIAQLRVLSECCYDRISACLKVVTTPSSFKHVEEIVRNMNMEVVWCKEKHIADRIKMEKDVNCLFEEKEERLHVFSDSRKQLCRVLKMVRAPLLDVYTRICFGMTVKLLQGDIRNVEADCILISTCQKLNALKGVGKLLQKTFGTIFIDNCAKKAKEVGDLKTGECEIVETGLTLTKYVALVNLPRRNKNNQTELLKQFEDCLKTCFKKVASLGCSSIAMTCIGSGKSLMLFLK